MNKVILAIIRGMAVEAYEHSQRGYAVTIGTRHGGWSMHLSSQEARELYEILGEVISAADMYISGKEEERNV